MVIFCLLFTSFLELVSAFVNEIELTSRTETFITFLAVRDWLRLGSPEFIFVSGFSKESRRLSERLADYHSCKEWKQELFQNHF